LPRILTSDIDLLDQQLDAVTQGAMVPGVDRNLQRQAQSTQYSEGATRVGSLRSSRWVINHSSIDGNVTRRQANYRRWLKALADVPNCHALYPELPDHCAPYMFPLYVDFPMPHFYWLKQMGVPVWRWDEMAVSTCPVARDYRLHLLHLPCHQSLSDDELNWIVAATQKTLGRPVDGAPE
jgi:perosamine synthetase